MAIEQTISTLYTIGSIAIIPAVLTLAGTVVIGVKSPPWKLHRALRQKTEDTKNTKTDDTSLPKEPQTLVVKQPPEGAMGWIVQRWSRTPPLPSGWVSSMKGGKRNEKIGSDDVAATGVAGTYGLQDGEARSDEPIGSYMGET